MSGAGKPPVIPDTETMAFYDRAATDYADRFKGTGRPDQDLLAFMDALTPGATVLDLGCGPGQAAALLARAGFAVEATDASAGMVRTARERYGVEARQATFDDLDAEGRFDGIWANFCLLHAARTAFPGHLARIYRALKPGGVLHLGMKTGTGEARDKLGRFYTFYTAGELTGHLVAAGFEVTGTREFESPGMAGDLSPGIAILARA